MCARASFYFVYTTIAKRHNQHFDCHHQLLLFVYFIFIFYRCKDVGENCIQQKKYLE